jgi:APA family basic amino acid/polyamine antiporter
VTIMTGVIAAVFAGLVPLDEIASLANAGTLTAFVAVAFAVMVLRVRSPELPRPFTTPLVWLVAPATIAGCAYLFASLQTQTMLFFLGANAIGAVVYLLYGRTKSRLAQA